MKSMNSKIRVPFMTLIVVFPLVMLLLFNLAFRVYIERNTRSDLRMVVATVETVVRQELPQNLRDFTESNLDRAFAKLYKAMSASKLAVNVDMLLFSRNDELIYPLENKEDDIEPGLGDRISNKLPQMEAKKIYTLRLGAERYLVLAYPLTNYQAIRPTIVFVAQTTGASAILHSINIIMLGIMLIGILLAALIANRLARRISRPVSELCEMTKEIGNGNLSLPTQSKRGNDIIEINQLYKSIDEMSSRLEASDRTQKTFFQNASHELKTPLMSIQGYAEGISKGVLPDYQGAAEIIGNESKRLNDLVEELLTLSRIENQTYERELIPLNLSDVLKEYAQRLGGLSAKSHIRLDLDIPDYPLIVLADDTLLSQAVINISSNCLRYAKTAVNISLLQSETNAVIRISDDGGGIAEADLPHIFGRFYKGKGGHSGLGLAIAKSAVEAMNGNIRAYNDGQRAVFEITLPLNENKKIK